MSRVKRGKNNTKKRRKLLSYTKGFRWRRKSGKKAAGEALVHAWTHAFRGRKQKKRDFRQLWNVKINAAARENGFSYSRLINALKAKNIKLDRKILADLAQNEPVIFSKILEKITSLTASL